jgi:hypothetical protein
VFGHGVVTSGPASMSGQPGNWAIKFAENANRNNNDVKTCFIILRRSKSRASLGVQLQIFVKKFIFEKHRDEQHEHSITPRTKIYYFRDSNFCLMRLISALFLVTFLNFGSLAHEFHVGFARADYEEGEKMLFCSIQLEIGDFEHWIEDRAEDFNIFELARNQKNSVVWHHFEKFVFGFFGAKTNLSNIQFELFEIEIEADGRIFMYVVAYDVEPFTEITWQFSLLMGHSMEQQNKLEFKYLAPNFEQTNYVYFFETEYHKSITIKPSHE